MGRIKKNVAVVGEDKLKGRFIAFGIDPGFAKFGLAVVTQDKNGGDFRVDFGCIIHTKKFDGEKKRSNLRVTNDDGIRYKQIALELERYRKLFHPYAAGVEGYRVFGAKGANGAKTLSVYGGVHFWGALTGVLVAPFLPNDLKKRFCHRKDASKEDVEKVIRREVEQANYWLNTVCEGDREHLADGIGHAVLMLEDAAEMRAWLG